VTESVRVAQATGPSAAPAWLGVRTRGVPLYVYPDLDCPPGHRPTVVTECVWSLPVFECTWLGGGAYTCEVKRWDCQESRETWQCATPSIVEYRG
jgi:hypothetical protein